jgi:hypothetical protein
MAALLISGSTLSMAQQSTPVTIVQFPGTCLKWLGAAEHEIHRKHLSLENYMISIIEEKDHMTVVLKSLDAPSGSKGSGGTHPGFAVEIAKADAHVLKSYFLR